jgi:thiol-disulfide isomerase/thioredoxin
VAGFKLERVASFKSECMVGFVGIRILGIRVRLPLRTESMRNSQVQAVMVLLLVAGVLAVQSLSWVGFSAPRPAIGFKDAQGRVVGLDAFDGKVVILDFWATWCKPCRDEFPVLDQLQARLGPRGLIVVAVSIDRGGLAAVNTFYDQLSIVNLAKYTGDFRDITNAFDVHGLPNTFVLDRHGNEVVRFEGPADWEGTEISAILTGLLNR